MISTGLDRTWIKWIKYTNQGHYGNNKTSSNSPIINITAYKAQNTVCSNDNDTWATLDVPDAHSHVTQLFLTCFHSWEGRVSKTGQQSCSFVLFPCAVRQKSLKSSLKTADELKHKGHQTLLVYEASLFSWKETPTCHYNLTKHGNTNLTSNL